MEIQIRHQPSFAAARALLAPGEVIRAESGAMMAMAPDIQMEAKAEGGILKSLKRAALGGESFFITTATAGPNGGWIDLAATLPGDATVVTVTPDAPMLIQASSFLACEAGVTIDTKWGGMRNLAGGEGGFLIRASGSGEVILSCYGAIDRMSLPPGQQVVVDSGHMVAFAESVAMTARKAASGWIQTAKTGEYMVYEFTGPGELLIQSRNPGAFMSWIRSVVPTQGA